jgi:triosephosphate isomerase
MFTYHTIREKESVNIQSMVEKKVYIVANWKSNKNSIEVGNWFNSFSRLSSSEPKIMDECAIIVCPPFVHLKLAFELTRLYKLPIKIGAQDVSPFEAGAYTGAVTSAMVAEYAGYAIVGHSERRMHFKEDDAMIALKVEQAISNSISPILCIQSPKTPIPPKVSFVAYEPISAIGTGNAEDPKEANNVGEKIKKEGAERIFLYGGSVKSENIQTFLQQPAINGVLVGGASLSASRFWEMILHAKRN